MPPRIRVVKAAPEEPEENIDELLQEIQSAQDQEAVEPENLSHPIMRRSSRIAFYSAAVSLLVVILFTWLSMLYTTGVETQFSEQTSITLQQLDARISKLENAANGKPQPPKEVSFTVPDGAPRVGDARSPVTIVEFADFQCPFCGRFHTDVLPQILKDYVNKGKASFVYQDFAFLGEESTFAAEAAKCASDQGKFWEYHDYLFTHQNGENEGAFAVKNLKTFAKTLKLDTKSFNACLDSHKYQSAVDAETAVGRDLGVSGTPTLLINGKVFVGALPYSQFQLAIEEALGK